jgi:hypothetical protein
MQKYLQATKFQHPVWGDRWRRRANWPRTRPEIKCWRQSSINTHYGCWSAITALRWMDSSRERVFTNLVSGKLKGAMGICSLIICFSLLRSRLCSVSGGAGVASCSWRPGTPSFRGNLRQVPLPVLSIGSALVSACVFSLESALQHD